MTLWNKLARETKNDDDLYRPFLDRLGADHIECIEFINFGDPIEESFLEDIKIKKHVYSTGDTLSKLAYDHYSNPKLWWVLAWFNGKPTDFHCNIGDVIIIPLPIDRVLQQAYNMEQEF